MIHRYYMEGQKLDVAGLNEITVLVDRSETELTEIGWNCWRPSLDGPPHIHNDKDQIFYITDGEGIVKLGSDSHDVTKGNLVYVPAGIIHQTITTGNHPLCYILFNVFNNPGKEGHATFAEHIEKVKKIRKKQAETGFADLNDEMLSGKIQPAKFIRNVYDGRKYDFGSNSTILLFERSETNRCELTLVSWPPGNKGAMVAHKDKEQTFYILVGSGKVTIGSETEVVKPGDVVFVPRNVPHTSEAFSSDLVYLCMNALVNPADESFENMYRRVAPGRIERWKKGDDAI